MFFVDSDVPQLGSTLNIASLETIAVFSIWKPFAFMWQCYFYWQVQVQNHCQLVIEAIRFCLSIAHLTCGTANTSVTNCYDPISVGRPSSDCENKWLGVHRNGLNGFPRRHPHTKKTITNPTECQRELLDSYNGKTEHMSADLQIICFLERKWKMTGTRRFAHVCILSYRCHVFSLRTDTWSES
jgi:hypothetical protein